MFILLFSSCTYKGVLLFQFLTIWVVFQSYEILAQVLLFPHDCSVISTVCRRQSSHCGQRLFSSNPNAHSTLGLFWAPGHGPLVSLCTNAFPLLSGVHYCLIFWFPHASLGWERGVCYVQVSAHVGPEVDIRCLSSVLSETGCLTVLRVHRLPRLIGQPAPRILSSSLSSTVSPWKFMINFMIKTLVIFL